MHCTLTLITFYVHLQLSYYTLLKILTLFLHLFTLYTFSKSSIISSFHISVHHFDFFLFRACFYFDDLDWGFQCGVTRGCFSILSAESGEERGRTNRRKERQRWEHLESRQASKCIFINSHTSHYFLCTLLITFLVIAEDL